MQASEPSPSIAMSGADAAWLHMDRPRNPMVVTTILHFDQRPDWDAVQAVLERRVVQRFARFRQRAIDPPLTIGLVGPSWRGDPGLRIERHLSRCRADSLQAHLAARAAAKLDPAAPRWHADFVDLPSGAALVLRTHHALADGAGLVRVITAATDAAAPSAAPRRARARDEPADDPALERRAASLVKMTGRPLRRGAAGAPLTAPLSGDKGVAQCNPVATAALKRLGRAAGASVNDVYLAALAGALKEHLGAGVRTHPELDVIMPVNVRKPDEPADELGNRFGLVVVALPLAIADARELRAEIARRTQAIKTSVEAEVAARGLAMLGRIPRAAQQAWVDRYIGDAVAVVTNVAGPPRPVALAGTPVANISLLVPCTGPIGLGISLFSYDGRAAVSVIADRATMPDCSPFARTLVQGLESGTAAGR